MIASVIAEPSAPFVMSPEVLRYSLYQRTNSLLFPRLYQALPYLVPGLTYHKILAWEAGHRSQSVRAAYQKEIEEDFATLLPALPENPTRILDIGCGMGGADVCLFRHYRRSAENADATAGPEFHLFDKSHTEEKVFYRYHDKSAFYNALPVAKAFLTDNGLPASCLYLHEAPAPDIKGRVRLPSLKPVDLIFSLVSWGYHYPVVDYLEDACALLRPGGVLILDVRTGTDGREKIEKALGETRVLQHMPDYTRVAATKH